MTKPVKRLRCAIYTRVSSDAGLEQDFNSLDAQHGAAQAYIRSQAHEGWTPIRARYDDGGFSGGSTARPALQKLLSDIQASQVDIVVVYKVDRLTRSLADFAKLVELFDAHNVSFVSVTQQFNTTTSMGRLTLNVLLSFAQFEREVTSERIRDKIAASKRKGIWVGGMIPLGYDVRDKKPVVNEEEAERVRAIFRRYLELGSLGKLLPDLRKRGVVTKVRHLSTGQTVGGIPFTRGPLALLLRNRFYLGEVVYKGEICPGSQTPILDRELFDGVQAKLAQQRSHEQGKKLKSGALLLGRIFDDRGNRMTPSHSLKQGQRYRYYVSSALFQNQNELLPSVPRVSATEIESHVCNAVQRHLRVEQGEDIRSLVAAWVARVDVNAHELIITFAEISSADGGAGKPDRPAAATVKDDVRLAAAARLGSVASLTVPWKKTSQKRHRELITGDRRPGDRPIRAESRARLVEAIARGRRWFDELKSGAVPDLNAIARREGCSKRHVSMTVSLAFLAPSLVAAAAQGRLPEGVGVARLVDAPAEWSRQYRMLALEPPFSMFG